MTVYLLAGNALTEVAVTTFSNEGIYERNHLQSALKCKIDVVAPHCLIISEEFAEWSGSQRRIDLLAVDKGGNLVVIELKRTETGEHMELQALRYAAMVSTLTFSRAVEIYQDYLTRNGAELSAQDSLLEFLGWEEPQEDDFALDVRIVLVSSDFSKELTTSVMWLNERNLDIRCVRLTPYRHQSQILIDVQQIIPLPEAESYQIKIKQQTEERREARKSAKDFTRYTFQGAIFNKRKLVLAVVQYWITENKPNTFSDLLRAFPQEATGPMFAPLSTAKDIKQGIPRYFLGDAEIINFPDSTQYAVSNQWGKSNIERFICQARAVGLAIEEMG